MRSAGLIWITGRALAQTIRRPERSKAQDGPREGQSGQGFIEYGLILALMALVAILALTLFGAQISNLVNTFAQ